MSVIKQFGKLPELQKQPSITASPNFNGKAFDNPIPTKMDTNPFKIMKEYIKSDSQLRKPSKEVPIVTLSKHDFQNVVSEELKLAWLGHATSLIEIDGIRILTDPVFSERVSPFSWAGPKRLHKRALATSEIPVVDVIVISHNHYDHFDFEFIQNIKNRKEVVFICPLAVGESLKYWGVSPKQIVELDWHETHTVKEVSFTATPARHFTGRGLLDRNKSLWASFVIAGKRQKVFFCGDSGFFKGFEDIGNQYGNFDVTMVGIGAYNEMWQAIHTNPEEAVEAHRLLKGKYFLPIHWCTFDLALHTWQEPADEVMKNSIKKKTNTFIPKVGELLTFSAIEKYETNYWWQ